MTPPAAASGCLWCYFVLALRILNRVLTAITVRFSFSAIEGLSIFVSSNARSCASSSGVHGRPLGRGPVFICPSPSARSDGGCHAFRTLLAFVPPFRALTASKVSRSPILMPSGSIPEALRSLMCKNKSASAPSTAMNPKPRSAFHVFNIPAGILFPLF
jgi:hypothetical protein